MGKKVEVMEGKVGASEKVLILLSRGACLWHTRGLLRGKKQAHQGSRVPRRQSLNPCKPGKARSAVL